MSRVITRVMATIRPFRGVRPDPEVAGRVVAPPYDVLSEAEARAIHSENPKTFLQVTRPEVNLPDGVDAHSREAYAAGRIALETLLAEGSLVQDEEPSFYLYFQKMGDHRQTALMALCSTEEYDRGLIKKHEHTRPDKEQDRVDHILGTGAQTGLVFLAYRQRHDIREAVAQASGEILFTLTSEDGVEHGLTRISDRLSVERLQRLFDEVDVLYIADGHHRSAAASRVAARLDGQRGSAWFLCGIFPDDSLNCMAYNRMVRDLGGFTPSALLKTLDGDFEVTVALDAVPTERGTFTMYLEGRWYLLEPRVLDESDPVACLDVAVLQDRILSPLLGIEDPRRDTRVSFVGGIRGPGYLQDAVDERRAAVAFHMVPTGLDQLFAVADADRVMPPKSTWFEPKLAGGVLVHRLE